MSDKPKLSEDEVEVRIVEAAASAVVSPITDQRLTPMLVIETAITAESQGVEQHNVLKSETKYQFRPVLAVGTRRTDQRIVFTRH